MNQQNDSIAIHANHSNHSAQATHATRRTQKVFVWQAAAKWKTTS